MKGSTEKGAVVTQVNREPAGVHLQQIRLQKNLTLEDVAAVTKISLANLRAIEAMDFSKLPAETFVKGMLIAYAELLGENGRLVVEQFLREWHHGSETPLESSKQLSSYSLHPKKLAEPSHISSATVAGLLLVVIVMSFAGFCLYTSWNPFVFITNQIPGLTSSVVNAFHPADPATSNGAHKKAWQVSVHFTKESKVVVLLDEHESIQQTYSAGTTMHWGADRKIQIQFFQPDCAQVQLNGAPIAFPVLVDARYLLQIPAQASGS